MNTTTTTPKSILSITSSSKTRCRACHHELLITLPTPNIILVQPCPHCLRKAYFDGLKTLTSKTHPLKQPHNTN